MTWQYMFTFLCINLNNNATPVGTLTKPDGLILAPGLARHILSSSGVALLTVVHLHSHHSHHSAIPPHPTPNGCWGRLAERLWSRHYQNPVMDYLRHALRQRQCLPRHFMSSSLPLVTRHTAAARQRCWWYNLLLLLRVGLCILPAWIQGSWFVFVLETINQSSLICAHPRFWLEI